MVAGNTTAREPRRDAPGRSEFRFWAQEKLRNADTDQFGHINHAAMTSLFEAGRMELFAGRQPDPAMKGVDIVVVRLLLTFYRELHYPGTVDIGGAVGRVGNSSFDVRQGLFDASGCVAAAEATCVLVDGGTRRPVRVSDTLRGYLTGGSK